MEKNFEKFWQHRVHILFAAPFPFQFQVSTENVGDNGQCRTRFRHGRCVTLVATWPCSQMNTGAKRIRHGLKKVSVTSVCIKKKGTQEVHAGGEEISPDHDTKI